MPILIVAVSTCHHLFLSPAFTPPCITHYSYFKILKQGIILGKCFIHMSASIDYHHIVAPEVNLHLFL